MVKKILLGLLAVLVVIQFIRPERNIADERSYHLDTRFEVPGEVAQLLEVACNDCHSNKTAYPWYANLQPVAWWLDHHVTDGKRHLNFSEFTSYNAARQFHKLEEVVETVEDHYMPMEEYTWLGLHPEANLDEAQRELLISWAKTQMDTMRERYPADSLVMRRGPQPPAKS